MTLDKLDSRARSIISDREGLLCNNKMVSSHKRHDNKKIYMITEVQNTYLTKPLCKSLSFS